MTTTARPCRTLTVVIHALFPDIEPAGPPEQKYPLFHPDQTFVAVQDGTTGIFISNVLPLAAPFILFRLKRTGFSGCRVIVKDGGLLVTASR